MAIGHKDHRGIPVRPTVSLGGRKQPFDLGLRQVFAGAQSAFGGRFGVTVRFTVPGATSLRCDFAMSFAPRELEIRTDGKRFGTPVATGPLWDAPTVLARPGRGDFKMFGLKGAAAAEL